MSLSLPSLPLPLSLSHMHTYSLSPHPPSLPLPALSLTLTLALLTPLKQLKHSGSTFMRGLRWGLGGGGSGRWGLVGWRGLKTAEILLAESCRKQVSFESGFKQRKGRRISHVGWQGVPDKRCKKAEGTLSERFGVALWDFQELLTR